MRKKPKTTVNHRVAALEVELKRLRGKIANIIDDEDERDTDEDSTYIIVFHRDDVTKSKDKDEEEDTIAEFRVTIHPYERHIMESLQRKMKCRDKDHPDCIAFRVTAESPQTAYEQVLRHCRNLKEKDRACVIDRL